MSLFIHKYLTSNLSLNLDYLTFECKHLKLVSRKKISHKFWVSVDKWYLLKLFRVIFKIFKQHIIIYILKYFIGIKVSTQKICIWFLFIKYCLQNYKSTLHMQDKKWLLQRSSKYLFFMDQCLKCHTWVISTWSQVNWLYLENDALQQI